MATAKYEAFPRSTPHYHDVDSSCLQSIPAVPRELAPLPAADHKGPPIKMVAVGEGWYRCTKREAYYVHDHGGHFVSHYPLEKAGCPA